MLRLGRLVCGRLLFAAQIFVLAERLCSKINFRHIAHQPRQSLIATTSLRSALGFCRRSSPLCWFESLARCGTLQATYSGRLFRLIKELVQSVSVWQYCLRLSNVQSCCTTLEYRLRNICSNEFGIYSQLIFQTFGFSAHPLCLHCSNLRQPFESLVLV